MKKRTRAEYTKRIDKVFSYVKGYTHKAEYLERLANPSLEKWNFIQLGIVAQTEFDVCQLQFWHNPSPELFQRMVDALHIQYIAYWSMWKKDEELRAEKKLTLSSELTTLPGFLLAMTMFADDMLKERIVDVTTEALNYKTRNQFKLHVTTLPLATFLYQDILTRKGIIWGKKEDVPIAPYDKVLANAATCSAEEVEDLLDDLMTYHLKTYHIDSFIANPFTDPIWSLFPVEAFALYRYWLIKRKLDIANLQFSDAMLAHYAPYLQQAEYKVSPHIQKIIDGLE